MRLLLDTHVWLWFRNGSPRLGPIAQRAVVHASNDVLVSVASITEGLTLITVDSQMAPYGVALLPADL